MNVLRDVIGSLSKDEVKHIKLLLGRTHRDIRKDIQLFDIIRKSGERYSESEAFDEIYESGNKNAFHGLKSKLLSDIIKGLFFLHSSDNNRMKCAQLIAVCNIFEERHLLELALYFNNKAEKIAKTNSYYDLLELIYRQKINYTDLDLSMDPLEIINERKKIQEKLHKIQQIDDLIALVSHRIKSTFNLASHSSELEDLLEQAIENIADEELLESDPQLNFRLYDAVSNLLLSKRDYKNLSEYIKTTLRKFEDKNLFSKETHDFKLKMLSYLTNSLYKLNETENSLEFAKTLHDQMKQYNSMHYEKYLMPYSNAVFVNYYHSDKKRALEYLQKLKGNKILEKSPFYPIFMFANSAFCYYQLNEFTQAVRSLNELYHHPGFARAAITLRFNIRIAELIIRFEIGDFEFLQIKLKQLYKDFENYMEQDEQELECMFLDILNRMSSKIEWHKDDQLVSDIKSFRKRRSKRGEINKQFIPFNNWLKNKLDEHEIE